MQEKIPPRKAMVDYNCGSNHASTRLTGYSHEKWQFPAMVYQNQENTGGGRRNWKEVPREIQAAAEEGRREVNISLSET